MVSGRHLHRVPRGPPAGCEPQGQTVPNHSPACRDASLGLPRGPWAAWSLALENQRGLATLKGGGVSQRPCRLLSLCLTPALSLWNLLPFYLEHSFLSTHCSHKRLRVGLAWHSQAPPSPSTPREQVNAPAVGESSQGCLGCQAMAEASVPKTPSPQPQGGGCPGMVCTGPWDLSSRLQSLLCTDPEPGAPRAADWPHTVL